MTRRGVSGGVQCQGAAAFSVLPLVSLARFLSHPCLPYKVQLWALFLPQRQQLGSPVPQAKLPTNPGQQGKLSQETISYASTTGKASLLALASYLGSQRLICQLQTRQRVDWGQRRRKKFKFIMALCSRIKSLMTMCM